MLDQEKADEGPYPHRHSRTGCEVADAFAVSLPRHDARDDGSRRHGGDTESDAVQEADEQQQRGSGGCEVQQRQGQAQKGACVEHPRLTHPADPLAGERPGHQPARDEDARCQAGYRGGDPEPVGGELATTIMSR